MLSLHLRRQQQSSCILHTFRVSLILLLQTGSKKLCYQMMLLAHCLQLGLKVAILTVHLHCRSVEHFA